MMLDKVTRRLRRRVRKLLGLAPSRMAARKAVRHDPALAASVTPVALPVLWLFQLPRSGGTMFLRLFDCHPQVHVHPAPISFQWPRRPDVGKVARRFSLDKFKSTGFYKLASNREQAPAEIDFDEARYRAILDQAPYETARELFDAANTARFNAWRNYRNLPGQKRFVLMHSTIWRRTPVEKSVRNFFAAYPDGFMVFIARCPEDWLASATKLRRSSLNDMDTALGEYIAGYNAYLAARAANPADRMIVLEFNRLVSQPKLVLSGLCERLGIAYDPALETTTVNGMPVAANSSHEGVEKYAPDPALIGRGAELRRAMEHSSQFQVASGLFREVCAAVAPA